MTLVDLSRSQFNYSTEQILYIRKNYMRLTDRVIGFIIGRTEIAVREKRYLLKLKKNHVEGFRIKGRHLSLEHESIIIEMEQLKYFISTLTDGSLLKGIAQERIKSLSEALNVNTFTSEGAKT